MKNLNSVQASAIKKIGDIYCPRYEAYPSFSELGNIEHIDVLLNELPPSDLKDLKLLLFILGLWPSFFIKLFLNLVEVGATWNGPLGPLFRMIRFGFRGIVFALYYSGRKGSNYKGETPSDLIGYKIQMRV